MKDDRIGRAVGNRNSRYLIPAWQDTDVLEAISKSLSPLVEFTDALSGEKYVSVSFVKPMLHLFNTSILAVEEEDPDPTRSIKMKILAYLNDKYSDPHTQELLDMASALGPRFKLNYVSEDNMGSIQARLTSEMAMTVSVVEMGPPEMAETHGGDDTEGAGAPKKKTLGSFFKATEGTAPGPQSQGQAIASELQSYLQATILDSE
ncbi:uncharacterized protein LOC118215110 isoform X1 [Anguilla anguilla]|uniref:uncharacterized protein LOC118215110 isoform X1 n=1 Tax=Anguilla anguilla TaxID=7936 RepID=UPI0015ACCB84|nr:uncharacterized protein LOC118215110 isoform X1 [Anguilla anguilla]XP_035251446.1 uncharacterized protein LOC118215110 isoform X1 [Anguilla anguilla]